MYQLGLSFEKIALEEGVEIRLNTTVTPEYIAAEKPDALILAVGSTPIVPPLPGIDGDNVVVVNDYYLHKDKVGDTVVVLGGGLAGCECAVHLGQEGKKVHLVEMRDTLAPDCNIRNRPNAESSVTFDVVAAFQSEVYAAQQYDKSIAAIAQTESEEEHEERCKEETWVDVAIVGE